MKLFIRVALALTVAAGSLGAQALETKTIELLHLKPKEAVKLLSPYVRSTGGGVFDVSETIGIVTIRDTPDNILKMEQVLAKYDHNPATVRFVFQLIEADTGPRSSTGGKGNLSLDLDSTLRSVLKFPAYRLLSQSVATAGEFSDVRQQLAIPEIGADWAYYLTASVGAIRFVGGIQPSKAEVTPVMLSSEKRSGTVHLNVRLNRSGLITSRIDGKATTRTINDEVISTGLDVPIGHTVVLGTAATRTSGVALILTVRPELVAVRP